MRFYGSVTAQHIVMRVYNVKCNSGRLYLPGAGINHDHQGGFPRERLVHCTSGWLTSMIIPNVDNSGALFLLVGFCVRADPDINRVVIDTCLAGLRIFC